MSWTHTQIMHVWSIAKRISAILLDGADRAEQNVCMSANSLTKICPHLEHSTTNILKLNQIQLRVVINKHHNDTTTTRNHKTVMISGVLYKLAISTHTRSGIITIISLEIIWSSLRASRLSLPHPRKTTRFTCVCAWVCYYVCASLCVCVCTRAGVNMCVWAQARAHSSHIPDNGQTLAHAISEPNE